MQKKRDGHCLVALQVCIAKQHICCAGPGHVYMHVIVWPSARCHALHGCERILTSPKAANLYAALQMGCLSCKFASSKDNACSAHAECTINSKVSWRSSWMLSLPQHLSHCCHHHHCCYDCYCSLILLLHHLFEAPTCTSCKSGKE